MLDDNIKQRIVNAYNWSLQSQIDEIKHNDLKEYQRRKAYEILEYEELGELKSNYDRNSQYDYIFEGVRIDIKDSESVIDNPENHIGVKLKILDSESSYYQNDEILGEEAPDSWWEDIYLPNYLERDDFYFILHKYNKYYYDDEEQIQIEGRLEVELSFCDNTLEKTLIFVLEDQEVTKFRLLDRYDLDVTALEHAFQVFLKLAGFKNISYKPDFDDILFSKAVEKVLNTYSKAS